MSRIVIKLTEYNEVDREFDKLISDNAGAFLSNTAKRQLARDTDRVTQILKAQAGDDVEIKLPASTTPRQQYLSAIRKPLIRLVVWAYVTNGYNVNATAALLHHAPGTILRMLATDYGVALLDEYAEVRKAEMVITQDMVLERLWNESDPDREGTNARARVSALELLGMHVGLKFVKNVKNENVNSGEMKLTIVREIVSDETV